MLAHNLALDLPDKCWEAILGSIELEIFNRKLEDMFEFCFFLENHNFISFIISIVQLF